MKSYSQEAKDNCTCQDDTHCCPAHFELYVNTYLLDLETMARNLAIIANNLKQLEVRRNKHFNEVIKPKTKNEED